MQEEIKINSNFLKITGEAELPEPLQIGREYIISVRVAIPKKELEDNEDGTFSESFKARMITCEVLKDNGEIIKSKDRRRASQKLRNMIRFYQGEIGDERDEEEFYQAFMAKLMANFDGVVNFLKNET